MGLTTWLIIGGVGLAAFYFLYWKPRQDAQATLQQFKTEEAPRYKQQIDQFSKDVNKKGLTGDIIQEGTGIISNSISDFQSRHPDFSLQKLGNQLNAPF